MVDDLWTLADRIARNREIAGLHYESDTAAGVAIARSILPLLATTARYQTTRDAAKLEWQ
jgi:acid phosphatase (class A)